MWHLENMDIKFNKINLKKLLRVLNAIIFFCFLFLLMLFLFDNTTKELGNGYKYYKDLRAIMCDGLETIDIVPTIIAYSFDDIFIVAKQRPRSYREFTYTYDENYSYSKGLEVEYYWLVIKKEKTVFGPLLLEDFESLCKNNKVSSKMVDVLKIKSE